jgi:hypothetical protein
MILGGAQSAGRKKPPPVVRPTEALRVDGMRLTGMSGVTPKTRLVHVADQIDPAADENDGRNSP